MASDFTVIIHQPVHLGNESGLFGPGIQWAGPLFETGFPCPNVNSSQRAVLMFQTRSVQTARSTIKINNSTLADGIPVSSTGTSESPIWNGNVAIVEANVLQESNNRLQVQALNPAGTGGGNLEDFLLDTMVIFFKTR
jgi:hypothetical protein